MLQGDSGSPVICGATETSTDPMYVAGIASWTVMVNGYCNENYPTVYTRIGFVRDWIRDSTPPYP